MKEKVYVVTAVIEEEFYCDRPEDVEATKEEIRETFRDYNITGIRVSDEPETREIF